VFKCKVIFWNIAPKHWIYMDRGYCNSFYFYLWLYNYWAYVIECVFAVEGHIILKIWLILRILKILHNFQLKLHSIALYYFMSTLYTYSNWNYQNLPGKNCRIEKNPIMILPYSILVFGEIIVLYHKKFQNLNINKSYFCIFDGIRRNFNCRSIYKNLFYALNYIIYGVKAWITYLFSYILPLLS
jgi:hypothetical protein